MPAIPQTLLIPFNGGLDTYSNPHLLKPGILTAATGIMLDRPGSAYPGPGYLPQSTFNTANTVRNHGIGSIVGPGAPAERLVFWQTPLDGVSGPQIVPEGTLTDGTAAPIGTPVAPWRQATQRFTADSRVGGTPVSYGSQLMMSSPMMAVASNVNKAFYVWQIGTRAKVMTGVCLAVQDLDTRLWAGPYFLDSGNSGSWLKAPDITHPSLDYKKLVVACDSFYLRIGYIDNGTNACVVRSFALNNIFQTPSTAVLTSTATMLDVISTGEDLTGTRPGAFITYEPGVSEVQAYPFNGSSSTIFSPVSVITGIASATKSPIGSAKINGGVSGSGVFLPGTGFLFAAVTAAHKLVITATDTSCVVQNTSTSTDSFFDVNQISLSNRATGTPLNIVAAVQMKEVVTSAYVPTTWDYVQFLSGINITSPTFSVTTEKYQRAWGGVSLLGKFYSWNVGGLPYPVILVRTGWKHASGAFGTISTAGVPFAYPTGFLYDWHGNLYARVGDADVGTHYLWPTADEAESNGRDLQPLSGGAVSSDNQLIYSWPQYGSVAFFSSRIADAGSPIEAVAALATVTWTQPSDVEPPAGMVQFQGNLIIPGTITANYDGANVTEAGFFMRAPTPNLVENGTGDLAANTTYYYQTVVEYEDAAGKVHYSAPSRTVAITTTLPNTAVNIQVPRICQTLKPVGSSIIIRVYRSLGNPGTFGTGPAFPLYRLPDTFFSDALAPSFAGTSPLTVTVADPTSDTDLAQCAPIYTYYYQPGAASGTDAPPPFDSITLWNNQAWGLANRNGPELWCTWPGDTAVLLPEGPTWATVNRIPLPVEVGAPKGIAGLDEKLIVFGTKADFGLVGGVLPRDVSVADNPGLFSSPVLLPTPGGMRVLNSLTRLPDGILIQASQGFSLLGRDLKYKRVGAPVNDFASQNLYLPGVFLADQQAVLLFSNTGPNLLYFYEADQWSAAEQIPLGDVTTTAGTVVGATRAISGNTTSVFVLGKFTYFYYQIVPYSNFLTYRTPWIEFKPQEAMIGSVAGYGMLRELQVLGDMPEGFTDTTTLTLLTEYDYPNNTFSGPDVQSLVLSSDTQAQENYQWRFGFSQGNATRVRFTLVVDGGQRTVYSGNGLPPFLITGLMLSYDVDTGLSRLGAANSAGT